MPEFPGNTGGRFDYNTDEHYTGVAWVDGLPIYRRVIQLTGGNNSTVSAAIAELASANRSTIIRVDFALTGPFNNALLFLTEQISVADATGVITIDHSGVDFTGLGMHVIVEYTRAQP